METIQTDVVVVGAGPGGYTVAFYTAVLGKKVILIEQEKRLGGVCLNRGCIPSKALLHIAKLIYETTEVGKCGVTFARPAIHLDQMRAWKDSILEKLGEGIANLAGRRSVQVITGRAVFEGPKALRVETLEGPRQIQFDKAIIATGSRAALPAMFDIKDSRVMTSTEALALQDIPKKLLVVGGGYIGMELGTVYAALGSEVTVAEALGGILLGADSDLVRLVHERASKIFKEIRVSAKVTQLKPLDEGIEVRMMTGGEEKREVYDRVLVSVGRTPNVQELGLEKTKVRADPKGFIQVDARQRTAEPDIYAIGDVTGGMMLAHKASKDAKTAVNSIVGEMTAKNEPLIPAVVFTDPELAWCGLTEVEAKAKNIPVQIVKFPWSASGRALTLERTDGATKLLIDPLTEKILGVGICGVGAGELISEGVLAVEMGLRAQDLARIVHPHPTLSETLMECAEMFYGHATHAYSRKRF
ncbi:MAG: dihydrolipoyl dehydrogenase [Omnitrophica bacterium RIFOXYB12_FULL_50_7]|nr:MAG: dihydrolipoyl dehydrogenase [Omnitrophica bacterium RIFOXYB12_FULL_50_7]